MTDYAIIERDGCKYVTNIEGDILYEATGISNARIAAMVRNREYVNWRIASMEAPNTRACYGEKKYNVGRWFEEGDSIFDVLKKHPKRTYADCLLIAASEGFRIDECGILRRMTE